MSSGLLPKEPNDLSTLNEPSILLRPKPKPQPSPEPDDEGDDEEDDDPAPFLQKHRGEYFRIASPFFSIELQSQQVPIHCLSTIAGEWAHVFSKAYKRKKRMGYV